MIRLVWTISTPTRLATSFVPEARRSGKLELHHTPNHGSWLNMAEIEERLQQTVSEPPGRRCRLRREVHMADVPAIIDWRFSTEDARSKLKHVYPRN